MMRLAIKFIASLIIGYIISKSESPIHELEKGIAGAEGVSDWYLIMRYIIGTGALTVSQQVMLYKDPELSAIINDATLSEQERESAIYEVAGKSLLVAAVGVGSGVGIGFLLRSWGDLE